MWVCVSVRVLGEWLLRLRTQIIAGTEAPAGHIPEGTVGENGGGAYMFGTTEGMRRGSVVGNGVGVPTITLPNAGGTLIQTVRLHNVN